MELKDMAVVKRDVEGILIPYGQSVTLVPGTEVLITQALGPSYTLNVNGNLVRISKKDADAIGKSTSTTQKNSECSENEELTESLCWETLKKCYDPEIPVNIVDLGLVYSLEITSLESGGAHIGVQMTLTAPGCGMGPVIVGDAENLLSELPSVEGVDVVLVFDPPWNSDMMSEEAKLELGML